MVARDDGRGAREEGGQGEWLKASQRAGKATASAAAVAVSMMADLRRGVVETAEAAVQQRG